MSVVDHIKPVGTHHMGIPQPVLLGLKAMVIKPNPKMVVLAQQMYEQMLETLEQVMSGKVPEEDEDRAAMLAGHLILDAAFIHQCLSTVGKYPGEFPYDYLVDKLLPPLRNDRGNAD